MPKDFVVSFFVDECSDEEMNTYIGSRFIPYIYEVITEHKDIIFLLPNSGASSESVARTVRALAQSHSDVSVQCRAVANSSEDGLFEKLVDMSDLSLFYLEKHSGKVYDTMKYAEETGKEYVIMK